MVAETVKSKDQLGHDSDPPQALVLLLSSLEASEQPVSGSPVDPISEAGMTSVGLGARQTPFGILSLPLINHQALKYGLDHTLKPQFLYQQ